MNRHTSALAVLAVLGLAATLRAESPGDTLRLSPRFADVSPPADHPYCLGPSFVTLKDGSVLTVYHAPLTYDSPPGATWIACRVTRDGGKSWSPERKIIHHSECKATHPTALRTHDGTLWVFYLGYRQHSWKGGEPTADDRSDLWAAQSRDEGKTWTNRQRIFKGYTGATNGAIETRSGRLVVPFSHYVPRPGRLVSVTAVSADGGKTWKLSNRIDIGGSGDHSGAVEPTVVELKDGRLWMLIRTEKGRFWEAHSTDHGLTWSKAAATTLDAAHAPGHLTRLADGRLALVWNRKNADRRELLLAFSGDDGKSWSEPIVFARGKQVCYPFVGEPEPGLLWIGFLDVASWSSSVRSKLVRIRTADVTVLPLSAELRRRCLDVLRRALKGDEFWPAMHAAEALTQAGHGGEVRTALAGRLKTEQDARKRCGLARELARAGDRAQVAVLLEILGKGDLDAQVHAAESLYKIAEVGDGKLLRKATGQEDKVALELMAASALARRGDRQALALIRKRLAGNDAEGRMLAAYVLARLGDETDIPPLRQNARREENPLKRSFALHALACLGDRSGREAMGRNLTDADPEVRALAVESAGVSRAMDLADKLTRLLDDKAVDVRVRAAQALLSLARPASSR